jgi:hypothetical protein
MKRDPKPKQSSLIHALSRGYFPHELSWLIDNPLRRLFIAPEALADRLAITETSRVLGCSRFTSISLTPISYRSSNFDRQLRDTVSYSRLDGEGGGTTPLPFRSVKYRLVRAALR